MFNEFWEIKRSKRPFVGISFFLSFFPSFFFFFKFVCVCDCGRKGSSGGGSPCKYHPLCVGTCRRWSGARAPCGHRIPISVYLFCVRLGGTESVTLVCVCVCVNSLHSRCLYVCAFAAYYSVYSCVSSVEKLAVCEGAVHARVCNSLNICLLYVCVRSFMSVLMEAVFVCLCRHLHVSLLQCVCVCACVSPSMQRGYDGPVLDD